MLNKVFVATLLFSLCFVAAGAARAADLAPDRDQSYRIGPGDELDITVLSYPELATRAVVAPDGHISFPFLGTIQAEGLSTDGLAQYLQTALDAQVYDPKVGVTLVQMRSKRFSVLGEVRKPGTFPLWGKNVTIYEAIASAEGFTPGAYPQQVRVLRADGAGKQTIVNLDLANTAGDKGRAVVFYLQPEDVVYVPGQTDVKQVCVLGKVAAPGRLGFYPGMTVVDALTSAGWITREGVPTSVMLARRNGAERAFQRVNVQAAVARHDLSQDVALKPGDIVYVPEKFISQVSTFVGFFTTSVEPVAHTYLRIYDSVNPANVVVER